MADFAAEMAKRRAWFFECQLRALNYVGFRGVTEARPDPRLGLISEASTSPGLPGTRPRNIGRVYLDDQEPVWTADERARHDAFGSILLGEMGDWLDSKQPNRLVEALADLRHEFEQSTMASRFDPQQPFTRFPRRRPSKVPGATAVDADPGDAIGRALSRAELARTRPWLIPELYNDKHEDTTAVADWVENLEQFVHDYETEIGMMVGGAPSLAFDPARPGAYRDAVRDLLTMASAPDAGKAVTVQLFDRTTKKNDKGNDVTHYTYTPRIATAGQALKDMASFTDSSRVPYWKAVIDLDVKEAACLKANSDMGMCQLVRALYLYGSLPSTLGSDSQLTWRGIPAPTGQFDDFVATRRTDPALRADDQLQQRFDVATAKLRLLLELSNAMPRAVAPWFSPLAGEVGRHAIRSYKYWLDEPLRAKDNAALNQMKQDNGYGDGDLDTEMEFWSENHYIMFASSEYLVGQLWEFDEFQPAKELLEPGDKTGILKGSDRKERGRARVLKWLNNRLQFGWMEFNSSGYYREHLFALLNLADFALDDEVRTKATIAIDLLLFDVARYSHNGSMGAPGGRSQFKSKNCGWDNDLGDVTEIIWGTRGVFNDLDSNIGAELATSTYVVPGVLFELVANPPSEGFVDRSRVSITFDESPKYGITWSQDSDAKDSVFSGYASKRAKYSPFLDHVNDAIARSHHGYGAVEDDTVFFWGMSAFFNKQVVRNTFKMIDSFNLDKSPAFEKTIRVMLKTILPLMRRSEHAAIGALFGGVAGAVVGAFSSDIVGADLDEGAADDLSIFLEGSKRTRANILAYRNQDAMLASIQNFRVGQLNFQSSVHQATLTTSTNVFTTASFGGLDISDLAVGIAGAVIGGAALGPVGAIAGGITAVALNEGDVKNTNPFGGDEDGPGWWTGYWALPMIAQHRSAAIIVYDFHDIQRFLADVGCHAWFPKNGFDRVQERRTSAYDDANFPLLDVTSIGPKGFWAFGKVVHPASKPGGDPREGYVGVFSNQRPKWLDRHFDLYERRIKEASSDRLDSAQSAIDDKLEALEDDDTVGYVGRQLLEIDVSRIVDEQYTPGVTDDAWKANVDVAIRNVTAPLFSKRYDKVIDLAHSYVDLRSLQRVWKDGLPGDPFTNRDWYVDTKNVWIIQVGNKAEFGSFDSFMDQVSSARIHLDDAGDQECAYDIPRGEGTSDRLTLAYGDGGTFGLNGQPFQTDLYPRFENPFVRGGRVEWGQREYCIEWNGKTLLHDFSDFEQPKREEAPVSGPHDASTIKAFVIYVKTEDEGMDAFTVATATVTIGTVDVTVDQVVAVGPAGDGTQHDAEWVFHDFSARRSVDMSFVLKHISTKDASDNPEWNMSCSLKALMGDRSLKDCWLSQASADFEDDRRATDPRPVVVSLSLWEAWTDVPGGKRPSWWRIASHPRYESGWHAFNDLFVLDQGRVWHQRVGRAGTAGPWSLLDTSNGQGPRWSSASSVAVFSDSAAAVNALVMSGARLFGRVSAPDGTWPDPWFELTPMALAAGPSPITPPSFFTLEPVPLGPTIRVTVEHTDDGRADLYLTGNDGNVYVRTGWSAVDADVWTRIDVVGLTLQPGVDVAVANGVLFCLGTDGALWASALDELQFLGRTWQRASADGLSVTRFAVAGDGATCRLAVIDSVGRVFASDFHVGSNPDWVPLTAPGAFVTAADASLVWANPLPGRWQLFTCGIDGLVYGAVAPDGTFTDATAWVLVGEPETVSSTAPKGGLIAQCRAKGQVEVFAQTPAGDLVSTWWS